MTYQNVLILVRVLLKPVSKPSPGEGHSPLVLRNQFSEKEKQNVGYLLKAPD